MDKFIIRDGQSPVTAHSEGKLDWYIDSEIVCLDIDYLENQVADLTITDGTTMIKTSVDYMDLVAFCKDVHLKYIKLKRQMSESKLKSEKLEKSFKEVYNDGDI